MSFDIYASVRDLMRPKSSGKPKNAHAFEAHRKIEPDYERMRELTKTSEKLDSDETRAK